MGVLASYHANPSYNAHDNTNQHNNDSDPDQVNKREPEHFKRYKGGQFGRLLHSYFQVFIINHLYEADDESFIKGSICNKPGAGII